VGSNEAPPSVSAVAPHPRAGCCGVSGPSPSAARDGLSERSKRRRRTLFSPPGRGGRSTRHPISAYRERCYRNGPNAGKVSLPCTIERRSSAKVNRERGIDQAGARHAQSENEWAPMRRGPPRIEQAPMRQEPLDPLRFSSETLERAGRRPALAFSDSSFSCKLPKRSANSSEPGTDGNLSCGAGVAKWTGMPVASPCRRKKTAARETDGHAGKAGMASKRHRKRCLSARPLAGIASDASVRRGSGEVDRDACRFAVHYSCRSRPSMPPATVTT